MAKYGEMIYLLGEAAASSSVPGLRGGVDGGAYYSPPQAHACHRAVD